MPSRSACNITMSPVTQKSTQTRHSGGVVALQESIQLNAWQQDLHEAYKSKWMCHQSSGKLETSRVVDCVEPRVVDCVEPCRQAYLWQIFLLPSMDYESMASSCHNTACQLNGCLLHVGSSTITTAFSILSSGTSLFRLEILLGQARVEIQSMGESWKTCHTPRCCNLLRIHILWHQYFKIYNAVLTSQIMSRKSIVFPSEMGVLIVQKRVL